MKPDLMQFQVNLPVALVKRLETTAEQRMVGRRLIVERALTHYLDHLDGEALP